MTHKNLHPIFAAAIVAVSTLLASCGQSDNPLVGPTTKKHYVLVKDSMPYGTDYQNYEITTYTYDAQGQLTERELKTIVNTNGNRMYTKSVYTYTDEYICETKTSDYTINGVQVASGPTDRYYKLNDRGLVAEYEFLLPGKNAVFEYDSDGRVSRYGYEDDDVNIMTWDDGDVKKVTILSGDSIVREEFFTFSDMEVDFPMHIPGLDMGNEPLNLMGFFGKTSRHLVIDRTSTHRMDVLDATVQANTTYDYEVHNGLVTKYTTNVHNVYTRDGEIILNENIITPHYLTWKELK